MFRVVDPYFTAGNVDCDVILSRDALRIGSDNLCIAAKIERTGIIAADHLAGTLLCGRQCAAGDVDDGCFIIRSKINNRTAFCTDGLQLAGADIHRDIASADIHHILGGTDRTAFDRYINVFCRGVDVHSSTGDVDRAAHHGEGRTAVQFDSPAIIWIIWGDLDATFLLRSGIAYCQATAIVDSNKIVIA